MSDNEIDAIIKEFAKEELRLILADIETSFESVVFDELQRRDADFVLTILQKVIAEKLK